MFILFVKTFKFSKKIIFITALIVIISIVITYCCIANTSSEESEKNFIKWVDFNVTYDAMKQTAELDISSHRNNSEIQYNWIELLSYLACKYGGNFNNYKKSDLDKLLSELNTSTMEELTPNLKYYDYYLESYSAVLSEFIGYYSIEETAENGEIFEKQVYGIKAYSPIAKNYNFSHYKDFGTSRSYGFSRTHLGNDLMGSIGTPIVAVEGGTVEALRLESIWWLENWN